MPAAAIDHDRLIFGSELSEPATQTLDREIDGTRDMSGPELGRGSDIDQAGTLTDELVGSL